MRARLLAGLALLASPGMAWAAPVQSALPWWAWPILLFVVAFLIGIVAVAAGIGGGVLFVPIVGSLFPFHLDFIRGAGLMLALCGSLAACPGLIRGGLASLRVALPLSLAGSIAAIAGAHAGLHMSTQMLQTLLGVVVLLVAFVVWRSREENLEPSGPVDALSAALGLQGVYRDNATGTEVHWRARHFAWGIVAFTIIGFLGGMFGLGAGWANVPALNLLMGVPLKLAVGTSTLSISVINTAAGWVYLNQGALLPILHVPSILGVILGARLGVRLLRVLEPRTARWMVVGVLLVAGARALMQGISS